MRPLSLTRGVLDAVLRHARETHPDECCGAIVSQGESDEVWRLVNVQDELHRQDPTRHPRTARTAYALGRADVERIDAATLDGPDSPALKAIYHSHSKNGAYFSGEDRAQAMFGEEPTYPDVAYLVVSDAREAGEARAFRWSDGDRDFVEVPVDVT